MSASNDQNLFLESPTSGELAIMRTGHGKRRSTRSLDSTGEYAPPPIGEPLRAGTVLLRNRDTGLFYGAAGDWVRLKEASSFASSYNAIETAVCLPERKLEVVFSFEDPFYDISIPIKQVERL
jgi:hypothetical protein